MISCQLTRSYKILICGFACLDGRKCKGVMVRVSETAGLVKRGVWGWANEATDHVWVREARPYYMCESATNGQSTLTLMKLSGTRHCTSSYVRNFTIRIK